MSTKIVPSTQNFPHVSNALKAFKTDDKTSTKIIKLIPNILKLIGAFFMDVLSGCLAFLGIKPEMRENNAANSQIQKSGIVAKVKSIWANHQKKILYTAVAGASVMGILFALRFYFSIFPDPFAPTRGQTRLEQIPDNIDESDGGMSGKAMKDMIKNNPQETKGFVEKILKEGAGAMKALEDQMANWI